MKKAICTCFVMLAIFISNAQNEKIIGEKGKEIIGEKGNKEIIGEKGQKSNGVIAPIDSKARLTKYRKEIELLFTQFQKEQADVNKKLEELRKKLDDATKELESQDKMGNFEIQNLMSEYNQAETLSSQILKKVETTKKSVVQKIGG